MFGWDKRFDGKANDKFSLVDVRKLYSKVKLSNLVSHRAIVYMPHTVTSLTLTELYSLTVPLFIPSMQYIQKMDGNEGKSPFSCRDLGLDQKVHPAHHTSIHPYSPDAKDPEADYYWMQFADHYDWPHMIYFDDLDDLQRKLEETDFTAVHSLMVREMKKKEDELNRNWCKALNKIQAGHTVPNDY